MAHASTSVTGKSPYQTANRTWRGRGAMLVFTAVILVLVAAAWVISFTRSIETTRTQNVQSVDPGVNSTVHPAGP